MWAKVEYIILVKCASKQNSPFYPNFSFYCLLRSSKVTSHPPIPGLDPFPPPQVWSDYSTLCCCLLKLVHAHSVAGVLLWMPILIITSPSCCCCGWCWSSSWTHTQGGSVARVNTLQCVGGAAHHCAGGPYWDLSEGCVCVITAGPAGH